MTRNRKPGSGPSLGRHASSGRPVATRSSRPGSASSSSSGPSSKSGPRRGGAAAHSDRSGAAGRAVAAAQGAGQEAPRAAAATGQGHADGGGLGRVADADVCAALAGELEVEGRLAGAHRQGEHQFLAVDLHFAKGVVLLGFARGQGRLAEFDAGSGKLEAMTVQVVAVGHLEAYFHGLVVKGAGRGAEGLLGGKGLLGMGQQAAQGQQQREKEAGESEGGESVHCRQFGGRPGRCARRGQDSVVKGGVPGSRCRSTPGRRADPCGVGSR